MAAPKSIPEPLSLYPILFIAAAFACGIALTHFQPVPLKVAIPSVILVAAAAVSLFRGGEIARATTAVLLGFFLIGVVFATVETRVASGPTVQQLYESGTIPSGDPVEVTGAVVRAPEPATDGFYLLVRVESVRYRNVDHSVSGSVWLFAPVEDTRTLERWDWLEARYGARMRVLVALKRADEFRNPGVTSFTEFLDQRGLVATGTIKQPGLVDRLDDERVFLPLAWLFEIRQRLLARVVQRFDPETAGVLAATLFGNRYFLSADTSDRFRIGGMFHFLIISGLHITVVGLFILWLTRRVTANRWWQFLVPVAIIWGYAAAVGGESATVRAALMFTIGSASFVIFRKSSGLNALGGAALLLLVLRPSDLFSPSFQLTFVAVLAIFGLAVPILRMMSEIGGWRPSAARPSPPSGPRWLIALGEILYWSENRWRADQARSAWKCRLFKSKAAGALEKWRLQRLVRHVVELVFLSLCVQLALLPLLVLYFHRIAPISLALNVLVAPLMALLSLSALMALLASFAGTHAAQPFVFLTNKLNWLTTHVGDPFLKWDWASWRLPQYSGPKASLYILYFLVLTALGYLAVNWNPFEVATPRTKLLRWHPRLPAVALIAFGFLVTIVVAHPLSADRPDGRLHVDFLDVGQGDSILVTFPDGRKLLIDGGGKPQFGRGAPGASSQTPAFQREERNIGEDVVSPYLWYRGFDSVDLVLATHADTDHMDGLNAVVRNFRVGAAFVGTTPSTDDDFIRLTNTLRDRRVPLYIVKRNDVLQFGPVTVEFLWPKGGAASAQESANNESVVTRISLGTRTFLFTGDIERPTEELLTVDPDTLACDVLKVAHHGSRTSSSEPFLTAAHPSVAVIEVGLTSIFGHPHPEVVERLKAAGASVMTTGRSGTITISTDGNDLQVGEFVH